MRNLFVVMIVFAAWLGVSLPARSAQNEVGKEPDASFTTLEAATVEIEQLNDRIAAIQATYEDRLEQASKRKDRSVEATLLEKLAAETATLRTRLYALESHEFILGAESLEAELGDYDVELKQFPVRFRSKTSAIHIAKKGAIPVSPVDAKKFQQQWQDGLIKPEAKVVIVDDAPSLALVSTMDNTRLTFAGGIFMTAQARKDKLERTLRPSMIVISAGDFEMGSDEYAPLHAVTIKHAFELSATEVTQGQWRALMGNAPRRLTNCGDTCPVEWVSWDDAQVFIKKLNTKTGKLFRLPSEAEWEYACKAGGKQAFCGSDTADKVAWYGANSGGVVHRVGSKQTNAFGLYDMSGNVMEWVEDDYQSSYQGAPIDGSARQGEGALRAARGGSPNAGVQGVRAVTRGGFEPGYRFSGIGFRLARTLAP
jgi:formylglycine-generating enzyme required for sulfatase activity